MLFTIQYYLNLAGSAAINTAEINHFKACVLEDCIHISSGDYTVIGAGNSSITGTHTHNSLGTSIHSHILFLIIITIIFLVARRAWKNRFLLDALVVLTCVQGICKSML